MQKIIFSSLLFFGIFMLSGCGVQKAQAPVVDDSAIILFYGRECPHCKIVEKYIAENNVKAKISFSEREVNYDKANADLMIERQKGCAGFDKKNVGAVPFLWTAEKCYIGQDEIVQFFKAKNNE